MGNLHGCILGDFGTNKQYLVSYSYKRVLRQQRVLGSYQVTMANHVIACHNTHQGIRRQVMALNRDYMDMPQESTTASSDQGLLLLFFFSFLHVASTPSLLYFNGPRALFVIIASNEKTPHFCAFSFYVSPCVPELSSVSSSMRLSGVVRKCIEAAFLSPSAPWHIISLWQRVGVRWVRWIQRSTTKPKCWLR